MPEPFRFDRRFDVDVSAGQLWDVLAATDRYPTWWPWLRDFEGGSLTEGAVARCVVRAPLPYTLRFDVAVQRVVPESLVDTWVEGDLVGPARLEIEPRSAGATARLIWSLELRDALLRPLALFARPAMTWAHDRIIEVGFRDFERHALDGSGS